jgi:hypothetical protein
MDRAEFSTQSLSLLPCWHESFCLHADPKITYQLTHDACDAYKAFHVHYTILYSPQGSLFS